MESSVFPTGGDKRSECDWNPDYLDLKLPMEVGSTWMIDSSCEFESGGPGGKVKFTLRGTKKVVGKENVNVSGRSVESFVVDGAIDFVFAGGGMSQSQKGNSKEYFSPMTGLTVKTIQTTKAPTKPGGEPEEFTVTSELQSLDPR